MAQQQPWSGVHHVVDRWAATSPQSVALEDAAGAWSYAELRDASWRVASLLRERGLAAWGAAPPPWAEEPLAPRPLAVRVARSREFYALCVAAWRLGLPLVALSSDMPSKANEETRNRQAFSDLKPFALVSDPEGRALLDGQTEGGLFIDFADVLEAVHSASRPGPAEVGEIEQSSPVAPQSVMVYVYTGGTTKASKCVAVTHAMAMWEAQNYSIALGGSAGPGDKMLQYSSLYWGAAVFGQISVAHAVGGCACIGGCPTGRLQPGDALQQIVRDVEQFRITVLGIVPSQLRGAWPGGPSTAPPCVRVLISWADKCPVTLAKEWQQGGLRMVDLLIASEYWLALYSDCTVFEDNGVEKHVYRALPSLDARFMIEVEDGAQEMRDAVEGEVGEMYLSGPTTSPGYVCPDGRVSLERFGAKRAIGGKTYLRTRDTLRLLPGGGLVYSGRADSMIKHGGQWVDVDALQNAAQKVPGVAQAAILPAASGVDAFVVLHSTVTAGGAGPDGAAAGSSPSKRPCLRATADQLLAPFRVLAHVRRALPSARVHLCTELPLNSATSKVDGKALATHLEGLRTNRELHIKEQQTQEDLNIRFYKAWDRLALGLVCGPQLLLDTLRVVHSITTNPSGWPAALGLAATLSCGSLALRLIALPEIWAACTYLESKGQLRKIQEWLKANGPSPRWSKWLPLALAACLPRTTLAMAGVASCAYLGWVREQDSALATGFTSLALALAAPAALRSATAASGAAEAISPMQLDKLARMGLSAEALGAAFGLLGVAAIGTSPQAAEFLRYALAAPGLFYQAFPKLFSDEFEHVLRRRSFTSRWSWVRRWAEWFVAPEWKGSLTWDEGAAVVDHGNQWNQVYVEGANGARQRDSVGIVVKLHWELREDELILSLVDENGKAEPAPTVNGKNGEAASKSPLVALVEQVCGRAGGDLHGIDSLQAIQLTEAVRRELRKTISVSDVLRCSDAEELQDTISRSEVVDSKADSSAEAKPEQTKSPYRRIWLCGLGPTMCNVDWMVGRRDRTRHLDVPALQKALDRLVERHDALRARNWEEEPMYEATAAGSSLWQLWCSGGRSWTQSRLGSYARQSIYNAWPRCKILPAGSADTKTELLVPTVAEVTMDSGSGASSDERAFWIGGGLLGRHPRGENMFQVCVIPIFDVASDCSPEDDAVRVAMSMPPQQVQWYIYAVLEHGFCDGPTGLPLFADLLRLYGEEALEGEFLPTDAPDALSVLQARLKQSLKPLPEAAHPNDDIFHDGLIGWGWRSGYQRFIRFDEQLMKLLRVASRDMLGVSVDVAWLTIISAAFFRMFPSLQRLDLYLVVTCRDKPGEERMVGYFSSRRMLPLEVGDPRKLTILGLADAISNCRRQRSWRRPRPFEKNGACIEVNIVSQVAEGLPLGFQEVRHPRNAPSKWERGSSSSMNLRLDQCGRDDWDFRLQSHDGNYGWQWSTYYAQALGSVMVDMALRPTGPVVPPAA